MSLVVVVLLVGLALGWLTGGSLDRLGGVPLRRRRLVVLALLAQLAGTVVGGPFYAVGLVVSAALAVTWLAVNRGVRGTGLVALGLLANALVVAANGAMPVSAEAAGRAGVGTQSLLTGADARHELADRDTRLPWLGDVVPVPLPVRPEVVSPGDVLVAAGLAQLVVLGMRGERRGGPARRGGGGALADALRPGRAKGRPRRALPPPPPGSPTRSRARRPPRALPAPAAPTRPTARSAPARARPSGDPS